MSSPLTDALSASATAPIHDLTPRQRLAPSSDALPTAGTALSGAESSAQALGRGELVEPLQRINEVMRHYGVQFETSETGSQMITRLVDRESGEVIRQLPPEEVLRVAERIEEMQGRLIDLEV